MTIEFLPAAAAEVEEAVEWYNTKEPGLGEAFRQEVSKQLTASLYSQKAGRRSRIDPDAVCFAAFPTA